MNERKAVTKYLARRYQSTNRSKQPPGVPAAH